MSRRLSVSELRKHLPENVQAAGRGETVDITVRDHVVARLVGPETVNSAQVVLAVSKLLAGLPGRKRNRGPRKAVSSRKNEVLAGLRR